MTPIKPILVAALLIGSIGVLVSIRSRFVVRTGVLLLTMMGSALIIFPDAANRIAHSVGVGRGADLLLYVQTLSLVYILSALYRRNRANQAAIAEVVRHIAIATAEIPFSDRRAKE
jgi:hypothetical protein